MNEARGPESLPALVFAGGDRPAEGLEARLPSEAFVVGADSGIEHALAFGRHVDLAVGDFDSVAHEALARARAEGAEVESHPRDKDATDLELALDAAATRGATRVTIVGGHGGRLDHHLGGLLLLGAPRFAELELDAWLGPAHVMVVRRHTEISGTPGEYVSLFAVGGPASRVTTSGLRYPLRGETLQPSTTLGVSNELVASVAEIDVGSGVVLVVQPDALRSTSSNAGASTERKGDL